jgi:DNA helicase HerA-like ATPase
MESAEVARELYGWLGESLRRRATLLQPGSMIVSQPEVPVPLVVSFPFPAWATRRSEVEPAKKGTITRSGPPEWPSPE